MSEASALSFLPGCSTGHRLCWSLRTILHRLQYTHPPLRERSRCSISSTWPSIAACTVIEAFLGISPLRESRKAAIDVDQKDFQFPTPDDQLPVIDIVIVAYLPNEQDIVKDQVFYALDELVYPRNKLRINLGMDSWSIQ